MLADDVADRPGGRAGLDPDLIADAGQELQGHVRAGVAVPHRGAGFQVVGGVAGGRIPAVHAQRHAAHAGQRERLPVGPDPEAVPVGERGPDLPGQYLADQPCGVRGDLHGAASGKSTQARERNDCSNALIVSCTSAPWAKSPWAGLPVSVISLMKSLTRFE